MRLRKTRLSHGMMEKEWRGLEVQGLEERGNILLVCVCVSGRRGGGAWVLGGLLRCDLGKQSGEGVTRAGVGVGSHDLWGEGCS